ncbi:MAG: hypothetical protein U5Q44_06600 [Dehalococcoidia bacterium]|nr:hypothetical protein [Dehalococcoidia bacterium]
MTPRLRRALFIATAPLILLAAACNPLADPEGWATPLFTNGTLYYFPDQDTLLAVEVGEDGPEIATWEFPNTDLPAEENVDIEAVYTVPIVDDGTIDLRRLGRARLRRFDRGWPAAMEHSRERRHHWLHRERARHPRGRALLRDDRGAVLRPRRPDGAARRGLGRG